MLILTGGLSGTTAGRIDIHQRRNVGLAAELAHVGRMPADEPAYVGGPLLPRELIHDGFAQSFHRGFVGHLSRPGSVARCSELLAGFVGHLGSVAHRVGHGSQCNRSTQPKPAGLSF